MGICPCSRDDHRSPEGDKGESLVNLVVKDAALGNETAQVGFHADELIVREVDPLSAYYRLLGQCKPDTLIRAEFAESQQPCVVRVSPKDTRSSPRRGTESMLRTLLTLDHPHALKVYEVCQDSKNVYVVMEAFDGGELGDYLSEQGYLLEQSAALVMQQVLSCLAQCHRLGLVHRSLDLQTLFFKEPPSEDSMHVKLGGFENYDVMEAKSQFSPSCFTAPEVQMRKVTEKSDIWSCGVLLYVLLSGRNPFENYESSSVSQKLKSKGFSFPPAIWSHVSQDAIDLILLMMNNRPEARPTAVQCLAHPWVRHFARIRTLKVGRLSSLDLRAGDVSIKKAVLYFMINRVIDESELAKLSMKFTSLDADGDGLLSQAELLAYFLESLPRDQAEAKVKKASVRLTTNMNDMLDYSEFLLSCYSVQSLLSHNNLKVAFDTLDRDGSGNISTLELRNFFRIQSSEGILQWKELTEEFDDSGDGEINFSDFEALITKTLKDE